MSRGRPLRTSMRDALTDRCHNISRLSLWLAASRRLTPDRRFTDRRQHGSLTTDSVRTVDCRLRWFDRICSLKAKGSLFSDLIQNKCYLSFCLSRSICLFIILSTRFDIGACRWENKKFSYRNEFSDSSVLYAILKMLISILCLKNRIPMIFSNISNTTGPILGLIIFGTKNRKWMFSLRVQIALWDLIKQLSLFWNQPLIICNGRR